jgi:hypothetical protein
MTSTQEVQTPLYLVVSLFVSLLYRRLDLRCLQQGSGVQNYAALWRSHPVFNIFPNVLGTSIMDVPLDARIDVALQKTCVHLKDKMVRINEIKYRTYFYIQQSHLLWHG